MRQLVTFRWGGATYGISIDNVHGMISEQIATGRESRRETHDNFHQNILPSFYYSPIKRTILLNSNGINIALTVNDVYGVQDELNVQPVEKVGIFNILKIQ